MQLFHVSEDPDIVVFEPRMPPSGGAGIGAPVVWTIDEKHLVDDLFPRECPQCGLCQTCGH